MAESVTKVTAYEAFYIECYFDARHQPRYVIVQNDRFKREVVTVFGVDRIYDVDVKTGKVKLIDD